MDSKNNIKKYLARVSDLYSDIRTWCEKHHLKIIEEKVEVEEASRRYKAPQLIITDPNGNKIAAIKPIGSNIIGAGGRVDIVGKLDKNPLLYLDTGGPHFNIVVSQGEQIMEERSQPFFKGITSPGWYWIEELRLGRARPVEEQLFLDLLSEVSDYGFE